jgi:transcription-repair coupling factor (superfamily II helicase)
MKVEMIDRFGPMPEYAQSLFRATRLKLRAAELGIRKIDAGASSGYFIFEEANKVDAKRVLKLIQGKPKEYRLDGPLKLRFTHDARSEEKLFARVEQLVEQLS